MLLEQAYSGAPTVANGKSRTTVNEFADQQPALRPELLREVRDRLCALGPFAADKVLSEEDKGAVLAGAVALELGLPLAMARWYTYDMETFGGISTPILSEYFEGRLYVNGIEPGDRVLVVEDTISTGGTLISLIDAVTLAGARVVAALAAIEKVEGGGVERVRAETGVQVQTLVGIRIDPQTHRVRVVGPPPQSAVTS